MRQKRTRDENNNRLVVNSPQVSTRNKYQLKHNLNHTTRESHGAELKQQEERGHELHEVIAPNLESVPRFRVEMKESREWIWHGLLTNGATRCTTMEGEVVDHQQ